MSPTALDVSAVRSLLERNPDILLVDVRTPGEYENAHVPESINLPLDQVDAHLERIVSDAGGTMVLICQSGNRAGQCHAKLAAAGLTDAVVLTGGMNAWTAAGAPVVKGTPRWGLERQVRLVAGSIVLLAVLASIWFPPVRFLAGAVGAGLAFAAITDTCAMGMLLSKLPYNRPAKPVDVAASLARLRKTGTRA